MENIKTNLNKEEIIRTKKANIPLLEVQGLKKYFPVEQGLFERLFSSSKRFVHAVDDITFSIYKGEIFCLVGESGCGKTTTARILSGLEEHTSGELLWNGEEMPFKELKPSKGNVKTQIVFQNPYSSLSPRIKLGEAVQHPLIIHDKIENPMTKKKIQQAFTAEIILFFGVLIGFGLLIATYVYSGKIATFLSLAGILSIAIGIAIYYWFSLVQKGRIVNQQVVEFFEQVGLSPGIQFYQKYPHEVSGGERQRAAIARSLILNPQMLILDEPTSMLDVSLRAGILDLMRSLKDQHDISILFITHDLATARHFGDRIAVMYVGQIVEHGEVDELFAHPLHPYTTALINAIPSPVPSDEEYDLPKGEVADAIQPPSGCRFHPRCIYAQDVCSLESPSLTEIHNQHFVACHFPLLSEK